MKKKLRELYDKHNNHDITFNQSVIKSLGLVADQIALKCGDLKLPCIIYSSSLVGSRIIIKITEENIKYIKQKKGMVSLNYIFKIQSEKSNISFFINSKITHIEKYHETKQDFYYCLLEFINRAPDDLISILGEHIENQITLHKRVEERFIINNENDKIDGNKSLENFLFISGKGKRCILTEISMFSAKVIIIGKEEEFVKESKAMLIIKLKDLEGTGEMIGNIARVELVNKAESLYSIILTFNQDLIPPAYKMWIAEFLEMISIKK